MKYQTPEIQLAGCARDLIQNKMIAGGDGVSQSLHAGIPAALEE